MSDCSTTRESGFTMVEMMIAMALGLVVLGAAVQLYSKGVAATFTVSQRAEMQQDFRAASNMLIKDLSLAGAGLGNNTAIALPSTTTPLYGCDQTSSGTCHLGASNNTGATYPKQGATPYLYGLMPGYNAGPILTTAGTTDAITVAYTDTSFYLNCYTPKITATGVVTFLPPVSPTTWATEGCLPSGVATPQAVNDSVAGLTAGDLVLMTLNNTRLVVEVTGAVTTGTDAAGNTTYIVPFANSDVLKMNQTPAGGGLNSVALNISGSSSAAPCAGTGPCRLQVVTYYVDNTVSPARLMRQVSGHNPMPVAENIVYMKFSYDLFNDATSTPAINQPNPGSGDANDTASNGLLPNQITKINVVHMAIDSQVKGTQGYQGLDLQTSVSARNLTYNDNY